ncbi:MAG TPA: TetR/AcrR family transcriptional regulator [Terracidiphilus sp.]|jgi:AcrR family transcriptional regulator|nr:TetR/AcrR family transcriptional regulator [Terracidiphilus sp.]
MSKGDVTRQRIVALSAPLFNQHGFRGCSMQDVMQATGLEKGGLYRHFSSKEELAAESFRYALRNAVKTRTEGLETVGDPLDQLRYLIRRFVEAPSFLPGGCPLMNTAIDADDGNAVLRKLVLDAIEDWKERLAAIVQEGIRRREIRRSVLPQRIANTIIATLEGALMISRLEGSKTPLHDARESLEVLLVEIACPGSRNALRRTAKGTSRTAAPVQ